MPSPSFRPALVRLLANYSMLGVLAVLCVVCSWATFKKQDPEGTSAARVLARKLSASVDPQANILIVAMEHKTDVEFADALAQRLQSGGFRVLDKINGERVVIRKAIERLVAAGTQIDVIAAPKPLLLLLSKIQQAHPALAATDIEVPQDYWWPTFLLPENLLGVANRIAVIAVIAVGMTMVIVTGGIDLSVGSLVALSAVLTAEWIVAGGGEHATAATMVFCSLAAIAVCGLMGAFSGVMITRFRIPPFIATLAVMQIARGLALLITHTESVSGLPRSFDWLGLKADLLGIPNVVILMLLVYVVAHFAMTRSTFGRHVYAVGGNRQAARLSGIHVNRVLLAVYILCGAMAGLGGVIEASQNTSGDPKSGMMYELDVIAAVVVGGTSLAGGEGKILGTLIGAFIIGVIQNGMNLTKVESNAQKVVLGVVLLAAVLIDMLRKHGWRGLTAAE
jgi:ribose transport system permease protein